MYNFVFWHLSVTNSTAEVVSSKLEKSSFFTLVVCHNLYIVYVLLYFYDSFLNFGMLYGKDLKYYIKLSEKWEYFIELLVFILQEVAHLFELYF